MARLEDPGLAETVRKFVAVRVVNVRRLDLERFAFDGDQTFAAVMFHADGTVLGRWGTRSGVRAEAGRAVSVAGFRAALEGALELHAAYPGNAAALKGKQPPEPVVRFAENYQRLADQSKHDLPHGCIHCHNVPEEERESVRAAGRTLPDALMFPYPLPDRLGLSLDPDTRASVRTVAPGSAAERAGFREGDRVLGLEGQFLVSTADFQWVLHNAPADGELRAAVQRRDGKVAALRIPLLPGWRRGDVSWRESFWRARPGFRCDPVPPERRRALGLADGATALEVKLIFPKQDSGKAARNAGLLEGDVIVEVDGRADFADETRFLVHVLQEKSRGQEMAVVVLRRGERVRLRLPVF